MAQTIDKGIQRAYGTLQQADPDLKSVLSALLEDDAPVPARMTPAAPANIDVTPELRAALIALPHVFANVQPDVLSKLSEAEIKALYDEYKVIKDILEPLTQRGEAIKRIMRGHAAADAVALVTEATERDKDGFPVLARKGAPQQVPVEGTGFAFSLEYRGGAAEIDGDLLERLYREGDVTEEEYRSFTKEVRQRVVDEDKMLKAVMKDPRLLGLLKRITTKKPSGTSFFIRKSKTK